MVAGEPYIALTPGISLTLGKDNDHGILKKWANRKRKPLEINYVLHIEFPNLIIINEKNFARIKLGFFLMVGGSLAIRNSMVAGEPYIALQPRLRPFPLQHSGTATRTTPGISLTL
ncbi:MAG TPA: hypothetical protein VJ697_14970 [Nitrososphaeraceae archaeon]|nr:hypothetical protein [Nitrososphaeraceae archaeon]